MKSPRALSDPHVSPEPPNFPSENCQDLPQKSSSRPTGSLKSGWTEKVGYFMYKKKSTLTQETLDELAAVEDKKYYTSPYYKGLLYQEKLSDTSLEIDTTSTTTNTTTTTTNTGSIGTTSTTHEYHNLTSPYYQGLTDFSLVIHREKLPGTSPEADNTTNITNTTATTGGTHEIHTLQSPYYKGLTDFSLAINKDINRERPITVGPTSPGRESYVSSSSSSRTSFSVKMQEWGTSCFLFKNKEEKAPTIIKVYSSEESLRERGSEPVPPPSPPLSPPAAALPPAETPAPVKRVVVNAKDTSEVKEEKYVWADKYRPVALKDFICNKDKARELHKTVNEDECHHFIFEGDAGVGKRTMIWALLRAAFGADKVQARDECKTFDLKGEEISSIIVNVKESSQHVEVNLSDLKGYEKHVIVELIKETNNKLTNKMARCSHDNCRAIVLYEADKLSADALLYIRWVIERYRGCHKIFFCCNDVSKLQPLKAVCKTVRLFAPSNKEIVEVLEFIAKKEEIELPKNLAERIAVNSKSNLRQAIRSFEATWQSKCGSVLKEDQAILTGWEDDIADIAKSIVEKQSPKQLYDIRRKLQNLIEHSVSPEFIFDTLAVELKKNVDELLHKHIDKMHKEYNGSDSEEMPQGFQRKQNEEAKRYHNDAKKKNIHQFMRIEEFIAKFMSYYKSHLIKKAQEMMVPQGQPL